MIRLKGTLEEKDYIDYNIFHMHHAKSQRRMILLNRMMFPIMFLLAGVFILGLDKISYWVVGIIITVLWWLFTPKLLENTMKRKVKAMLKDNSNGDLFKERVYELSDDGLYAETQSTKNNYAWSSIVEVVESDDAIYLYISSIQAIILPIRFMDKEDYKSINRLLNNKVENVKRH